MRSSSEACSGVRPLSGGSAAAELLRRAQGGSAVAAEDPNALAEAVLELSRDRERLQRMGENGRRFTLEHHDRATLAKGLWQELQPLLRNEQP